MILLNMLYLMHYTLFQVHGNKKHRRVIAMGLKKDRVRISQCGLQLS